MPGPDLSGRWTFSPGDSALQIRTPDAIEFLIDHREPSFRLERTLVFGGRSDSFAIDLTVGAEHAPLAHGNITLYPSLEWDEQGLVFVTRIVQGAEESLNLVRYHLEANGTVLVADESLSGPTLSYQNRWVFVKQ